MPTLNPAQIQGGKAVSPSPRPRNYTPKEASAALAEANIHRSERWISRECAEGRIATLPFYPGRHIIPESELLRLMGFAEEAS